MAGTPPGTPAGTVPARGSARRWLVGGALVATGLLAGAALAARWQSAQVARGAGASAVLTGGGDTATSVAVIPPPPAVPGAPPPAGLDSGRAAAAAPRALTREDSLAIAAAVRERLEATQPAPRSDANLRAVDSLMHALERTLTDSIAHALHEAQRFRVEVAPPTGQRWMPTPEQLADLRELARAGGQQRPQPRVVQVRPSTGAGGGGTAGADAGAGAGVGTSPSATSGAAAVAGRARRRILMADVRNATGRRELSGMAAALSRALRDRLEAGNVYDVRRVPPSSDATGRSALPAAANVGAGAILTALLMPRGDSLVVQVMVTEVRRGYPIATVEAVAPPDRPLASVEELAEQLRAVLGALPWSAEPAPRTPSVARPPAPPAPPGTWSSDPAPATTRQPPPPR